MMKVIALKRNPKAYSCKAYLVLGSWNRLEDVNTLVDVGIDGFINDEIELISTGCGKKPVEQVVLTHGHFDHASGLAAIVAKYHPKVYAFTKIAGVDDLLKDGDMLKMGDRYFDVLHTPGHSNDSVCFHCSQDGVLFIGDTPLRVLTPDGAFIPEYVSALQRIARLRVEVIYSGHDNPLTANAGRMIGNALSNVLKATSQDRMENGDRTRKS
jgi:glyoxylase-like metal-dependent hydrolase (beta-lactamase superfamily II)